MFQFPSNGKAYPKSEGWKIAVCERIGFNSLQTGKRIQREKDWKQKTGTKCFNSLQTGKRIQRGLKNEWRNERQCFNSLQTGKRIQSHLHLWNRHLISVSIPFKRESVSKVVALNLPFRISRVSIPFKRESVSKVHNLWVGAGAMNAVSIPFKRESVSKERMQGSPPAPPKSFNSLQTGKRIQRR